MKALLIAAGMACAAGGAVAADAFAPPVLLKAQGIAIRAEAPGFAYPCWADVDGDGKKELVVGQFNKGKMRVFKNLGGGQFAAGEWLKTGEKPAEVPGVW